MKFIFNYINNFKIAGLIVFTIAVIFYLLILFLHNSDFVKIDKCLDSGGRFNYQIKECEYY